MARPRFSSFTDALFGDGVGDFNMRANASTCVRAVATVAAVALATK